MNTQIQSAYQAGIKGMPEPMKAFKTITMTDTNGEVLTGRVETEVSVRSRLAWERGVNGPFGLFERWIDGRTESLADRVAAMDHAGNNAEWLEGSPDYPTTGVIPALLHDEAAFNAYTKARAVRDSKRAAECDQCGVVAPLSNHEKTDLRLCGICLRGAK